MTFEDYKQRLKEISDILEGGDATLDESIRYFEESVKLSSECLKLLESKKGSIATLKTQLDEIIRTPIAKEDI